MLKSIEQRARNKGVRVNFITIAALTISGFGFATATISEELTRLHLKSDTPVAKIKEDYQLCRRKVKSDEYKKYIREQLVAAGKDPFVQGFAKGVLRNRLRIYCLEEMGYEPVMAPAGTYERIDGLPVERQKDEVNALLAEQPRATSAKEEIFGTN